MEKYGAVITGRYIYAVRNDGREFIGRIANVKALSTGTLVTIENDNEYRNVYLENLKNWEVYRDDVELPTRV